MCESMLVMEKKHKRLVGSDKVGGRAGKSKDGLNKSQKIDANYYR